MSSPAFPAPARLLALLVFAAASASAAERWTPIAPEGGFVSAVACNPGRAGEVWASGDDSAGIFRSRDDGRTWTRMPTPRDHSAYALAIHPARPDRVFAPNHFGRGLLMTDDAGASWRIAGAGLPISQGEPSRIHAVAIDPDTPDRLWIAAGSGLWRSDDGGATLVRLTGAPFDTDGEVRAVVVAPGGTVFAGTQLGAVYRGDARGTSWSAIIAPRTSLPVTDLALTRNALYIGEALGHCFRTTTFTSAGLRLINDLTGNPSFRSAMWTKLAAADGVDADHDRLYVGTVVEATGRFGFFASVDGGLDFVRSVGLGTSSVFSLAIDPADPAHVWCGTMGDGLFETRDGGATWTPRSVGLRANSAFAVAADPRDAQHLAFSATEALDGTPGVWETRNGGASWSAAPSLPHDAAALDFDPAGPAVLVGTWGRNGTPGVLRSAGGLGGPWTTVLAAPVQLVAFARDAAQPALVYAIGLPPVAGTPSADAGLYVSTDDGVTWTRRLGDIGAVAPHPGRTGEAIAVGSDAVATSDGFATPPTSLGLAAVAPGRIWTAVAFDPVDPTTVLVANDHDELFVGRGYRPDGVGLTWTRVALPARDVLLRRVAITGGATRTWYVVAATCDIGVTADATPGLFASDDAGATWRRVVDGLGSSDLLWDLRPMRDGRWLGAMLGDGPTVLSAGSTSGTTTGSTSGPGGGGGGGCGAGAGALAAIGLVLSFMSRRVR